MIRLNFFCDDRPAIRIANLIDLARTTLSDLPSQDRLSVLRTPNHMVCSLIYRVSRKYDINHILMVIYTVVFVKSISSPD